MFDIPENIKGMIFDCDGTLVDSMDIHWKAIHETFDSFGKDCPHEFLVQRAGVPLEEVIRQYNEKYDENIEVDEFFNRKHEYSKDSLRQVQPIQPVVDVAEKYVSEIPMAVISGGSRSNVEQSLESIGIIDYFEPIYTAETPLPSKPAPHMFLEAAEEMEVDPEECLVFEDGRSGIKGAQRAGMKVIDIKEYNL